MNNDFYQILGVSKNSSPDEIKKAYRQLAMKYHPDRGGGAEAEKKFKEINNAYAVLSDPIKRKEYDQFGQSFSGGGQGRGGFEGFDFSNFGGGNDFSFFGMGDIFGDLFGQAFSQVQAEIRLSPAQAVLGDKIKISVNKELLEFEIPPGTQNGASFRFSGRGQAYRGGKKGDLILTVKIELPKNLTKEQRELWQKLKESEQKKKWWQ